MVSPMSIPRDVFLPSHSRHRGQKLHILRTPRADPTLERSHAAQSPRGLQFHFLIMRNISFQAHSSSRALLLVLRQFTDKSKHSLLSRKPESWTLSDAVAGWGGISPELSENPAHAHPQYLVKKECVFSRSASLNNGFLSWSNCWDFFSLDAILSLVRLITGCGPL